MSTKKKPSKAELEKQVSRILEQARREPRFRASRERDALIDAIRHGHSDLALALLAHGVDPKASGPKGRSLLWYAAHWGPDRVIRDLVDRGAPLPDDVLIGPVERGDLETVRFLIRRGANVNCVGAHAVLPPHLMTLKRVLLTVAIRNISAEKHVDAARRAMRADRTAKWREAHPERPPLGDLEALPILLIKAGANVNRLEADYALLGGFIHTTLGVAAHFGLVRTVKAMLAAGADVNQKDTWGGTALFDAARAGHRPVVKILLAAGARTDLKRRDGFSPVSIAREEGFAELADEIERYKKRG